jgi:hypothetical protein
MEGFLELILTIILTPFESKEEEIISGINHIRNKPLRVFVMILFLSTFLVVVFGLFCLLNYLIRGYWI